LLEKIERSKPKLVEVEKTKAKKVFEQFNIDKSGIVFLCVLTLISGQIQMEELRTL